MKIALLIVLVLLTVGAFVIGVIAEDDGRGGDLTVRAWLISLAAAIAAVWTVVAL